MQKNENSTDRAIRAVAGVLFLVLGVLVFTGVMAIVFDVLAAIMLVTAATGFCPLYRLFGFSTKKK